MLIKTPKQEENKGGKMQLISVELKNIRSYKHAKIDFPTGIVMLSGDIGSGKSTILLAVEFALFGVLRGELSGNALLRNGTQEGSVELAFKIGADSYTIKRTLVRTKKSVEQDAGYILINGVKKDATAIELKSCILDLLGYPPELLTKSKNFVFRYTVYTPQEEMKRILMEDKEERVAILRKVFGVDKYERITQNAGSYAKSLRERQRAFDALLADVEDKKRQLEEAKKEKESAAGELATLMPQLNGARKRLQEAKNNLATIEKEKEQAELLTRDLHVAKTQLLAKQQQHKQVITDLTNISQQIIQTEKELPKKIENNDYSQRTAGLNQKILEKEKSIRLATMKIAEFNTLKKQSSDVSKKVYELAQCPTCLQQVTPEHKHQIISTEQKKLQEISTNLEQHNKNIKQAEEELVNFKEEIEAIRQLEKETAVAKIKLQHFDQLKKRKEELEVQNSSLALDVEGLTIRIKQLEEKLIATKDIGITYSQLRLQVEGAIQRERTLSIEHSTILQKEQHSAKTIMSLEQELEKKQKARKQLEKTQNLHQWLTDYFVPLMDVVEKHVMAKIHHEFDALFQQWFGMLIEDIMTARLDETFTPLIQQNGYDMEVEYLSGGERTACALAYRLALNKTINSLISSIKTKDLLILDEPTDGFSAEQLDKMRDVLDQLGLNQTIIVSHEQKIESFADRVIRIAKTDHTSQISF
jgi:exonuclease SbcC